MILKRTLTFENQNLKRCKIDSKIDYGSKKGEVIVYKKRQRARVDQPCKVPEELTSSSSSLTSNESKPCCDQSKSSRGRVRAAPSRFNDSIVGAWKSTRRKVELTESSHDDDTYLKKKVKGSSGIAESRNSKMNSSKGSKLFPRKDNGDSSEVDFDLWDVKISTLSSSSDANSYSIKVTEQSYAGFNLADFSKRRTSVVIDPISQAPDAVLKHCVPGAICVMIFGYSKNGTQWDYSWVRHGMMYPFMEFMDKFRDQTNLYKYKPSEFKKALEEAVLAENGVEGNCGAADISCPHSSATESDQEHVRASRIQARCLDTYYYFG